MFVLKAEIDSKEVNDWTVQQLVQEKKSQKVAERLKVGICCLSDTL